jgi:hypothetical protein
MEKCLKNILRLQKFSENPIFIFSRLKFHSIWRSPTTKFHSISGSPTTKFHSISRSPTTALESSGGVRQSRSLEKGKRNTGTPSTNWGALLYCTFYTVHCTLYTVYCILYTEHSTIYTVYCTIFPPNYFRQFSTYFFTNFSTQFFQQFLSPNLWTQFVHKNFPLPFFHPFSNQFVHQILFKICHPNIQPIFSTQFSTHILHTTCSENLSS